MAALIKTRTLQQIEKLGVNTVRKAYIELANVYNKILNHYYLYCHRCDSFLRSDSFYVSKQFDSGHFPICKTCLLKMATDYDPNEKIYIDNKQKTKRVLRLMNLPYHDSLYQTALKNTHIDGSAKTYSTAWQQMLTALKSLPQYQNETYDNSDDQTAIVVKQSLKLDPEILKNGKKRFGLDFSDVDIVFLETEYEDWITRYPCENKAQQILFQRICSTELDIRKAQKEKRDTKDLDKTLQDLMSSLSVKPSQTNANALTEAKTFGQLIQKWEDEKPIPEPDDEFKDVDNIGRYIDVFFKGHLAKMMGLKNAFSPLYERFMSKYTVSKPTYNEDEDSEELFNKIFGADSDGE